MATFFLTFKCHIKKSTHSLTMYPVSGSVKAPSHEVPI